MAEAHVKKACPFCEKEIRSTNLAKHFVGCCRSNFIAKYKPTFSHSEVAVEVKLKDHTSLYCNFGSMKSFSKYRLAYKESINFEIKQLHIKTLKEFATDYIEPVEVYLKEKPIIEVVEKLSNEKEAEYKRSLVYIEKKYRSIEDQLRRAEDKLTIIKETNEDLYISCMQQHEEKYIPEDEEDNIDIPPRSKKILGVLNFEKLKDEFKLL